jgi:hypothetical protein
MQGVFLPKLIAWSHTKPKHTCPASNDIDSTATFSQSRFAVTKFISNKSTIVRLFDLQSEPSSPTATSLSGTTINQSEMNQVYSV